MEAGSKNNDPTVQADQWIKVVVHAASTGISRVYLFTLWDYSGDKTPEAWGVLAKGAVRAGYPSANRHFSPIRPWSA